MPVRYVISHGRRIAVETLETPVVARKKHKKTDPFVMIPLVEAATALDALKCPAALVWVVLQYERWRQKSDIVRLPTARLRSLGLDRWVWGRALTRIERAGLIQIERCPGRAARVTFTP